MSLKKIMVLVVAVLTFIAANANNLLPNGSFDKVNAGSSNFPAEWQKGIYSQAQAEFKLVKHNSGKAIQIIKLNKNGWVELLSNKIPVTLDSTTLFEISGMLNAESVKSGSIVLIGFDAKGKRTAWNQVFNIKGSYDWKTIKEYSFIPANVKVIRLSLRINAGKGCATFDNLKLSTVKDSLPAGTQLIKKEWLGVYNKNNDDLPSQWHQKSWSAMETRFKATADRQGACLSWISGGAKFGIEPELWLKSVPAGTHLKMTARYRAYGEGKAVLMAEFYDKNERKTGEESSEPGMSGSWSNLTHVFTVPENTSQMHFYLLNRGRGTVRYISAALTKTNPKDGARKFPVTVYSSPAEGNRIIHNGQNLFNTIVDSPNSLSFDFWGNKELKDLAFVIEIPSSLKILQCFNSHPAILSVAIPEIKDIKLNSKPYKRYIYKNLKAFSLMKPVVAWRRQVVMAFAPVKKETALPAEFKTWYYMQDANSKSEKKELTVRVLPPLPKLPNPKNFPVYNWDEGDMNFLEKSLFMNVITKYEEANLKSRHREWRPLLQKMDLILEKRGWYMHNPEQDYTQTRIVRQLIPGMENIRIAVDEKGKRNKEHICPGFFLNDQKVTNILIKFLTEKYFKLKAKAGDYVLLDYEPWRTMHWCFCPECRKEFSRKNNYTKTLSANEIINKCSEQWVNFRIGQTAAINRKTASIIKNIVPGVVIVDYDYPVKFDSPDYRKFYRSVPKDPQSYEDCIDIHFSSFYHYLKKDAFDLIDANVKNLKRPVYMTPSLSRNDPLQGSYTTDEETLSPKQFRVKMLGAACSGSKGLCIYPGMQIDGSFFVEINRGMGEIAVIENFLNKGKRYDSKVKLTQRPNKKIETASKTINLPEWKPTSGHRVHKLNDKILISLFNFHTRYALYTGLNIAPELLPEKISVEDAISKTCIAPDSSKAFWTKKELCKNLLLKIPPMDVKFYILKPYVKRAKLIISQNNKLIHNQYQEELAKGKSKAFKPVISGKSKAVMTDVNDDGIPDIKVSTPVQEVVVSLKGGIVLKWQTPAMTITEGIGNQKRDSMCWDYFWNPILKYSSNNHPYKINSVKYNDGKFKISLQTKFKSQSLQLQKMYFISTSKASVKVNYKITNIAKSSKSISFWSHNFPTLGTTDKINDLSFRAGKYTVSGKGKNELVFLFRNNKVIGFKDSKVVDSFDKPEVTCSNIKTKAVVKFEMDPDYLNQIYFYRGEEPTFEWMTRKINLKENQSFSTWMQFSVK